MSTNVNLEAAIKLLESSVKDFNEWRMKNLTAKVDISGRNFSSANLEGAFLNGVLANGTNFSGANLAKVNLVQAELNAANFNNANLNGALLMYSELKSASFVNSDLTSANLMWVNATAADFSSCKMSRTILVEALLQNAKLPPDPGAAFLKYSKLEGTSWQQSTSSH
jgi:uncharacterized protein YjbI with pentapeptide repeats